MQRLVIGIVTPAPRGSKGGNRVTALRWARALRRLGHRVTVEQAYTAPCDVLIALHAVKSHDAIARFGREQPGSPLIVVLTGTDLYVEIDRDPRVRQSLELATRIIVLQRSALERLTASEREKTRVIVQSARAPTRSERRERGFRVCVLAHLRAVKDPLRAAAAARRLPRDSQLSVAHAGAALDADLARAAEREVRDNPRYTWLGELGRADALALLASSDALLVTSLAEGGANVVTEAIACGIPVLSSRVDGSIGLLGDDHPGYFAPGDTEGLAELLRRIECDPAFRADLRARSEALRPMVDPAAELDSWRALLSELTHQGGTMTELRLTELVQGGG